MQFAIWFPNQLPESFRSFDSSVADAGSTSDCLGVVRQK